MREETMRNLSILALLSLALVAGCGDDGGTDAGFDSGPRDGGTDTGLDDGGTDTGPGDGATDGGPTGFDFRTDDFADYTREDAMGMPAVSTALIPTAMKDAYQDATPDTMPFAGAALMSLGGLHMALRDDLTGLGLTPCSTAAFDITMCATQPVVTGGPTVAGLVIPDSLKINIASAAGFPNGRMLPDPVIDVTLAVILLDMTVHTPTTLVTADPDSDGTMGVNPETNDVAYLTDFPYLAAPHAP
jgi:hypothetical protein